MKIHNLKGLIFGALSILVLLSLIVYAYETGVTGETLKNGNGCTCHNDSPSQNVTVLINGPAELSVGESAAFNITITGGPLVRGGTNIAASAGILAPAGSDLRIENGELTHIQPKAPDGNAVTFQFNYTAPTDPGQVTLYANGNSVNFNGFNTGDSWNFAPNKIITVSPVTDIDDNFALNEYRLNQNYPNPFNPATNISFSLKDEGHVSLKIYNSIGDEIANPLNESLSSGMHEVNFNAEGYASGVYYYKIESGNFTEIKKMILLK